MAFQEHVKDCKLRGVEGLDILHQGLLLAIEGYPLPFVRRTVVEFVLSGEEGSAWWEALDGLCTGFGLKIRYLDQAAIQTLARWNSIQVWNTIRLHSNSEIRYGKYEVRYRESVSLAPDGFGMS